MNQEVPPDPPSDSGVRAAPKESIANEIDFERGDTALSEIATSRYGEGEIVRTRGDFFVRYTVAENCRWLQRKHITDDGDSFREEWYCDLTERIDHPNADFTDEQLIIAAQTDAVSAMILADRWWKHGGRQDAVFGLYMHAFALSGEREAFDAIVDVETGGPGVQFLHDGKTLDEDHVASSYVWARVGSELGFDDLRQDAARYGSYLRDAGWDLDEFDYAIEANLSQLKNGRPIGD
ncbi:MAG: hypothetical protein AAFN50_14370 [Pseudomonadota bacterium]